MIVCFSGCTAILTAHLPYLQGAWPRQGVVGWSSGHGCDGMDAWVPVVPRNRIINQIQNVCCMAERNKCIVFSVME